MKKIYILAIMVAFAGYTFAQRTVSGVTKMNKTELSVSKTPTDTLYPPSITDPNYTPNLYTASSGYVLGTNNYGDLCKANVFVVTNPYKIEGCLFWVGAKQIVGSAGNLMVKVLNCNGAGVSSTGNVNTAPGTELGTVTIPMNNVDTSFNEANGTNLATFSTPIQVSSDFAISFDFTQIGDDTLGIVSSTADQTSGLAPGAMELCWDKWNDGSGWHTLLEPNNWGIDVDMVVGVIIDDASGLVDGNYFIDGIKLEQNMPNPAVGSSIIRYEIQNNAEVILNIYDMTGKKVLSYEEGKQTAGKHNIVIDSEKLNSGIYYYSLKADNHRLTKKMTITQ